MERGRCDGQIIDDRLWPQGVFIFYVVDFKPLTYLDYNYPWWGHFIGLLLALSSMIWVPVYMIHVVWRQDGDLRQVRSFSLLEVEVEVEVEVDLL